MDPRVFLLICLAAASRHQPSPASEVEAEVTTGPKHEFSETDFQRLRDAVNSGDSQRMYDVAQAEMWRSFVKAHPKEGLDLFKKLAKHKHFQVRQKAAMSPAWPMLLETHNVEAWQLFQKLAQDEDWGVREKAAVSPAWPMVLQTHNAEAWRLFQKLATEHGYFSYDVRKAAVLSPAWPMLLQRHNAEAWQLFQKLAKDGYPSVRELAATSPAWPMLLETHNAEAWQLFQKLAKEDKHADVRKAAALSILADAVGNTQCRSMAAFPKASYR